MKKLNSLLLSALLLLPLSSSAQLPSVGGHASVPDSWLLSNGSKWHYQTAKSNAPAQLIFRQPTPTEKPIVEKAMRILENSSAKSMALLDGNNVVWVGYKKPANERSRFLSMSVGKTVASMAVGKAICAGKFSLNSVTQEIIFRSDVTVELIKHSAGDADVIWAARVSTKGDQSQEDLGSDPKQSEGLINYLMRDRHGSPFEHSNITFFVQAPIFMWREHFRHRIASYNEESGRYKVLEPIFYVPDVDRKLLQTGKAGHYEFVDGTKEQFQTVTDATKEACKVSYEQYQKMLAAGIAREVARIVLPVTIYSSAYVTMNARALMNFLSLRRKVEGSHFPSFPQREIEMVAEKYEEIFQQLMPLTHAAFVANGRVAP
jgi:thymidylate synthase (FAD)